jgi:predicted enzyme related to lactoylglutathione lyase
MAEFNGYAPGTPSWVDLDSNDPTTSRAFYIDLFGWDVREAGPEFGDGYAFFTLRDKLVAGVGPTQEEHTCWTTCFAVADADEVARRVERAGGTVMHAAFDVEHVGRTATLADPEGACFVVWQYDRGTGAEIANEPVSLSWNELATRDLAGAKAFYADVFGWNIEDVKTGRRRLHGGAGRRPRGGRDLGDGRGAAARGAATLARLLRGRRCRCHRRPGRGVRRPGARSPEDDPDRWPVRRPQRASWRSVRCHSGPVAPGRRR